MKKTSILTSFIIVFLFLGISPTRLQSSNTLNNKAQNFNNERNENKLVIVWSSDDPMVAERVALMYPHAAQRNQWFDEITLVIWGPSANLIADNVKLQNKLEQMKRDGIIIKACLACANEYGVTEKLKELGYDVILMGVPLTTYLKEGYKVLTF
ncbi:MAG: DsrE family protein [Bacteroidales bacterium]